MKMEFDPITSLAKNYQFLKKQVLSFWSLDIIFFLSN